MTTPDERLRALKMVNDILCPSVFGGGGPHQLFKIKRVPKKLKELLRRVVRHYPTNTEIDLIMGKLHS